MRALLLVPLLIVAPLAAGGAECACQCPAYQTEVGLGAAGARLGTSPGGDGALLVEAGRFYFAEDWLLVNSDEHFGGFSLWLYEESNGVAGLQRGDPICTDTPEGMVPDTILD